VSGKGLGRTGLGVIVPLSDIVGELGYLIESFEFNNVSNSPLVNSVIPSSFSFLRLSINLVLDLLVPVTLPAILSILTLGLALLISFVLLELDELGNPSLK